MKLVGQAVPDRYARELGEHLTGRLGKTAVLDAVIKTPEHPGGVLHRFLVTNLRSRWPQVGGVGALIVGGDLEGATGPGRRLLEDQGDVFAPQPRLFRTRLLGCLELPRQVEKTPDLLAAEILERKKAPVLQIHGSITFGENEKGDADSCE